MIIVESSGVGKKGGPPHTKSLAFFHNTVSFVKQWKQTTMFRLLRLIQAALCRYSLTLFSIKKTREIASCNTVDLMDLKIVRIQYA